jgi:hypothetical protein
MLENFFKFYKQKYLLVSTEPFIPLGEMAQPDDYHYVMDDTEGVCDLYNDDDDISAMPCV